MRISGLLGGLIGGPALLGAAICLLLLAARPAAALEKPIVYAFDRDFPPFSMLKGREPDGFEVDVLKAALANRGFKLSFRPMESWDRVLSELSSGKVNVVSGMTRTELREKLFLFPEAPTLDVQVKFFAPSKAGVMAVESLVGKTVAVRKGTVYQTMLEAFGGVKVKPAPTQEEGLRMVWKGEVDAYFGPDKETYYALWKNNIPDIAAVGQAVDRTALYFAVYKGDPDLVAALNAGLREIRLSGEYDRIFRKWFVNELEKGKARMLLDQAKAAAGMSYAPYSREKAGAVVATRGGKVYAGARIENAQSDLNLPPFAVALAKAVSAGDLEIAVAAGMTADGRLLLPTAQERQMLFEFGRGVLVVVEPEPGVFDTWAIPRLLPLGYTAREPEPRPAPPAPGGKLMLDKVPEPEARPQ
ncbi:MAG: transporter substrate-binding domain-containing protein [Thermodesulfobacteriota bacterium]